MNICGKIVKIAPMCAVFSIINAFQAYAEQNVLFYGPKNTYVYADPHCSVNKNADSSDTHDFVRIECTIDGLKTTVFIASVQRKSRPWFDHGDGLQIMREITAKSDLGKETQYILPQGGSVRHGSGNIASLEQFWIFCGPENQCSKSKKVAQLIVLGQNDENVALLAVGDSILQNIKGSRNGKKMILATVNRFPRPIEAMISTFSFKNYDIKTFSKMYYAVCESEIGTVCDKQ